MKIRSLILIGLLSSLMFAVALLPASLVWRLVGGALPVPMLVERVGGTVWDGYMLGRINNPVAPGPVVIRWDLHGLRFLLGEASVGLGVEGAQYRLRGTGFWGLWGKGIADFNGDMNAAMLDQALSEFGVRPDGVVKLSSVAVTFSGSRVSRAEGVLGWSGGQVRVRDVGPQPLDIPGIRGELSESEGNLILGVTETRENKPLGELSLMPEQGLVGVKVLKRVMAIAGMGSQGDEDKVLLNLQQPLPF